jgi:glycosyltransferase involved in cell wall biosynthesis
MFGALRDVASALATAAPVFFAAHHFGKQDRQVRRVWQEWSAFPLPKRSGRMAVFSDSVEHVDGVSTWCSRFVDRARAAQQEVVVPYCGKPLHGEGAGAPQHRLPVITSFALPFYDKMRLYVPSLIDTLGWAWREGITHVELATPGPMGLVGLVVAKILQLPVTASYHTEVPALINLLGAPAFVGRMGRSYLRWFYDQADRIFCFSSVSRDSLRDIGVRAAKIQLVPQAVDPGEFSPSHRSDTIFDRFAAGAGERPVILSVGRLSKEKNLPMIIEAVEHLQRRREPPVLVIVGDGPERRNLEEHCAAKGFVRFAGVQRDQVLKSLYASADLFVFASRVDTLGLVNMEAMSSGIPVLVPDDAGITEVVTQGVSAECYPFGVEGLVVAIERVLDDPLHARRLGTAAREAMIARWESASFSRLWESMVG